MAPGATVSFDAHRGGRLAPTGEAGPVDALGAHDLGQLRGLPGSGIGLVEVGPPLLVRLVAPRRRFAVEPSAFPRSVSAHSLASTNASDANSCFSRVVPGKACEPGSADPLE